MPPGGARLRKHRTATPFVAVFRVVPKHGFHKKHSIYLYAIYLVNPRG